MKRKGYRECEHHSWCNGKGWNYHIDSPHSWYVSVYAYSTNLDEAREQCIKNWKKVYGVTNRKKITLHIPKE